MVDLSANIHAMKERVKKTHTKKNDSKIAEKRHTESNERVKIWRGEECKSISHL